MHAWFKQHFDLLSMPAFGLYIAVFMLSVFLLRRKMGSHKRALIATAAFVMPAYVAVMMSILMIGDTYWAGRHPIVLPRVLALFELTYLIFFYHGIVLAFYFLRYPIAWVFRIDKVTLHYVVAVVALIPWLIIYLAFCLSPDAL